MAAARSRLWLDLVSSLLGVAVGFVVLAGGFFGPITVGGADLSVAAMGLFGAGFAAVGVGHVRVDAVYRGVGEMIAGLGAITIGLSYLVRPSIVPFVIGVLGVVVGGLLVLVENLGLVGERSRSDDG